MTFQFRDSMPQEEMAYFMSRDKLDVVTIKKINQARGKLDDTVFCATCITFSLDFRG